MKIHKLQCPNCSAKLNLESLNSNQIFCNYCGQPFYIDDENRTLTINKNININKTEHKRYTDDAEVIKAKLKDKEAKRDVIIGLIGLGILLLVGALALSIPAIIKGVSESQGKVSVGSYQELIGQHYKTVEAHFESAGFSNIELIDLNDAGLSFLNEEKVEKISVAGNSSFNSFDYFSKDSKVVITYH